jgi:hypothetical protein
VELRAKAVSVLSLTLPADTPPAYEVKLSFDGKNFLTPASGLPRAERLFTSAETSAGSTTVSVVVVAGFETGEFIFTEPSDLTIQWTVAQDGKEGDPEIITQQAVVREASPEDEAFLARLADPELVRRLLGQDFFDRQTTTVKDRLLAADGADARALRVISRLLLATRANEPVDAVRAGGGHADAQVWAESLWAIAEEYPGSSYAPYAAYYAGCCRLAAATVTNHASTGRQISAKAKTDPDYVSALTCLRFARLHGDRYLQPRACYMEACASIVASDFGEAARQADELAPRVAHDRALREQVAQLKWSLAEIQKENPQ